MKLHEMDSSKPRCMRGSDLRASERQSRLDNRVKHGAIHKAWVRQDRLLDLCTPDDCDVPEACRRIRRRREQVLRIRRPTQALDKTVVPIQLREYDVLYT